MLRCPSANLSVLVKRQEAVAFLAAPRNTEFVHSVIKGLKASKSIQKLLRKLDTNHMTVPDWLSLFKCLGGMLTISHLAGKHRDTVPIFQDINSTINQEVYSLRVIMNKIIDFEGTKTDSNLMIKAGVDAELDKKRSLHSSLPGFLCTVADQAGGLYKAPFNVVFFPRPYFFKS